jgi:hypothetical protein
MGLRIAAFAAVFNMLFWTSRLTLGAVAERRLGLGAGICAALLAPAALLLLARRVSPARASAFTGVASVSLLLAGVASAQA